MKIGIPKETSPGECRVATTPAIASRLREKLGFDVLVETTAGLKASFPDEAYIQSGCDIVRNADELWSRADLILKVRPPTSAEAKRLDANKAIISFLTPAQNGPLLEQLSAQRTTALAMETVPRISRAQKMDALSSMANIAGYRAVVEAANAFGRFFTGQITAAGKLPPAKVLVIGAGVAGLSAIGTARGLGAIVRAFDVRPEVAEQVNSMGGDFLMLEFKDTNDGTTVGGYAQTMSKEFIDAEMSLFAAQAKDVDIIITTALIPGKTAPILITKAMVESMRPGSVVVDLATEMGGNCELSEKDKVVNHNGVQIIGYTDLPSRLASTASQLYGTNLYHILDEMGGAHNFQINMDDDIMRCMTVVLDGEITWPPPPVAVSAAGKQTPNANDTSSVPLPSNGTAPSRSQFANWAALFVAATCLIGLALTRDATLLTNATVFILSCVIGWQVIWNVSPSLHTPLMSVTNAISGIIIVGGMLQAGSANQLAAFLGLLAIFFATINIAGGFLVTQRMLKMFRK